MSYCGVPDAVGELFNYSPTFQGVPIGDFARRDPRVPNVPTDRSWVKSTADADDGPNETASDYDVPTRYGIEAPESQQLQYVGAIRGVDEQVDHPYQTYNRNIARETLRLNNSLGREMLNDWGDAAYKVGGVGYEYDSTNPTGVHWASSPGYKGDAYDPKYNPQIYMRPGIKLASSFTNLNAVPRGQQPR